MIWQLRDLLSRNNWKIICAPKQRILTLKRNKTSGVHFGIPVLVLSTHTIYLYWLYIEVFGKSWFVNIYVELATPDPFHPSHPVFTWKGLHQIVGQHATIALTSHIHTWMIDAQDQAHGLFAKAPRTIKQQSIQQMAKSLNKYIWNWCNDSRDNLWWHQVLLNKSRILINLYPWVVTGCTMHSHSKEGFYFRNRRTNSAKSFPWPIPHATNHTKYLASMMENMKRRSS